MDSNDISRLTAALQIVGARLDARPEQAPAFAGPGTAAAAGCPVPCAQAERCLQAMRDAVRALELLLSEARR